MHSIAGMVTCGQVSDTTPDHLPTSKTKNVKAQARGTDTTNNSLFIAEPTVLETDC